MATVTSKDGTQIAYTKTGNGPALIIVQGALCYREFWSDKTIVPEWCVHAHWAVLGFTFLNSDYFGADFKGDCFFCSHGFPPIGCAAHCRCRSGGSGHNCPGAIRGNTQN